MPLIQWHVQNLGAASPATVGAAPGIASFTSALGRATGAAQVGATAGTANFTSPLGKATGTAVVGALAGVATFTSGPGKATGQALAGASAGALAAAAAAGKATGAGLVGALAGVATFTSAPGSASTPTPATVGAAPGVASFWSPPGAAIEVQTNLAGAVWVVQRPPPKPKPPDPPLNPEPVLVPARVGASPGIVRSLSPPGAARGDRTATVAAAPGVAGFSVAAAGARGSATVAASPASSRTSTRPGAALGYDNPSDEEIALYLLGLSDEDLVGKAVRTIDRDRLVVLAARAAIRNAVDHFLSTLGHRIASAARRVKKAGHEDHDKDPLAVAESADFNELHDQVLPELVTVAKDGAHRGLEQVDQVVQASLEQANERAVAWARKRAGELIRGVDQATRDRVAHLVARAEEEGWSNDDLADEIAGDGMFSPARADTIARTETAAADVEGNVIGWRESGLVAQKQWVTADADPCDACAELDGVVVGLDEDFDGGGPPLHPNCRCDVLPVLAEE